MEIRTGWEQEESWAISPLSQSKSSDAFGIKSLWRKVMAGSCMGVICGLTLTFVLEGKAHAEFNHIRQPTSIADMLGPAETPPAEPGDREEEQPASREALQLKANLNDDYRYRIPAWSKPARKLKALSVTATAYNNVPAQTDATPNIAAWGDYIEPGMPLIAVSRDLVKMGLTRGTRVRVSGLDGEFVVLDKMNKRYRKRIDIYMGKDIRAARHFGRKRVTISWREGAPSQSATLLASQQDVLPRYFD